MAPRIILQRRRSDGSLALIGSSGSENDPDRGFPVEWDFPLARIGAGDWPAVLDDGTITLEYVNARATYTIIGPLQVPSGDGVEERPELGFHAVLEASELYDATPVATTTEDGA